MNFISDMRFASLVPALKRLVEADDGCGAGLALVVDGEIAVDLVDGYADRARRRLFSKNTLTPVFSTAKTIVAVMMARLIGAGRLTLDQRVADVWPEFAANGKEAITIGDVLGHRAGLAAIPDISDPEAWFDRKTIVSRLAAMRPLWDPGASTGYHAVTFGHLADEIYRRVTGQAIATDFRLQIGDPHRLDLWLGLPRDEHHRVAETEAGNAVTDFGELTELRRQVFLAPGSSAGGRPVEEWREACLPAVNGHGTARGFARLMGALANDGVLDDDEIVPRATIALVSAEGSRGDDLVLPHRLSWGAGFIRNAGFGCYGPSPDAFGHSGWGGSCTFADPTNRLAFAYVPTRHNGALISDSRARTLVDIVYSCL